MPKSPAPITGVLEPFFETGTEGVIWSVLGDPDPSTPDAHAYDRLHHLAEGDHVTILRQDGAVVWTGIIAWDHEVGWRRFLDGKTRAEILVESPEDLAPLAYPPQKPSGLFDLDGRYTGHCAWVASLPAEEQPRDDVYVDPAMTTEERADLNPIVWPPISPDEAARWERRLAYDTCRQASRQERKADHDRVAQALVARSPVLTDADRAYMTAHAACDARVPLQTGQQAANGLWVHGIQQGFEPDAWGALFQHTPPLRATVVRASRRAAEGTPTG